MTMTLEQHDLTTKIGINGFGRIGRSALRVALARTDVKVVAINHTAPSVEALLHALRYDSTHGRNRHFDQLSIGVDSMGSECLCFNGDKIMLSSERDPSKLRWDLYGAEYILECTGKLTTQEAAYVHIAVGKAKKVIISAPSKDAKTFVYGVNHLEYHRDSMDVVSNASCTTNCLAPIAKVLDKAYGIQAGMLTTVHASTASQHLLDGFSKKNLRLGRSAANNIIPTSTGAANAVKLVLPQLEGKFTGMSVRVPVSNVSMIDLTVTFDRPCVSLNSLLETLRSGAKEEELQGVLHVCDTELVSSDFLGRTETAIVDSHACFLLNDKMAKVVAWYDNETAYSSKALDLAKYMHSVDSA